MELLVCGINYKTAHIAFREKISFSGECLARSLRALQNDVQAEEIVLLSTCNRTEFYCIKSDSQHIMDWLHRYKGLPKKRLQAHWYVYQKEQALRHLLRVACGLNSPILGEPQILGQIKLAFSVANSLGSVGVYLKPLFQYIWAVTKQVRYETDIAAHPVSLAFAVATLARSFFPDLTNTRVLLVGAGETITLTAKHLFSLGIRHFWIANRTLSHSDRLALMIQGQTICLNAIPYFLPKVDIVVTATAHSTPFIDKKCLKAVLGSRPPYRTLFLADLGMPRDIDPSVRNVDGVYLYTLDDLQTLIQKNQQDRKEAAEKAEALIESKVQVYLDRLNTRSAAPLICAYRQQAERWRELELKKAFTQLKKGTDQKEVLKRLAYRLTNKLIHAPSVGLATMAKSKQKEALIAVAAQLLEVYQ